MRNRYDADACAKADELIRSTLRRRRDECARGLPGSDPAELAALIQAFWEVLSHAREHLLRSVGHRAAAAYRGFDYQGSEDVLHDSLVKACELLVAQYNGDTSGFVFDTENGRSIVGWITSVVGEGFGTKAGVLGTHLQRERRNAARFIEASSDENMSNGIHEEALLVTDGIDPARQLEAREALNLLAGHVQDLEPERRFVVETLLLYNALCENEGEHEFWDQIEKLTNEVWTTDQQRARSAEVVRRFRQDAPSRLTMGYILDMIKSIVDLSHKQLTRWYEKFIKDFIRALESPAACLKGA